MKGAYKPILSNNIDESAGNYSNKITTVAEIAAHSSSKKNKQSWQMMIRFDLYLLASYELKDIKFNCNNGSFNCMVKVNIWCQ